MNWISWIKNKRHTEWKKNKRFFRPFVFLLYFVMAIFTHTFHRLHVHNAFLRRFFAVQQLRFIEVWKWASRHRSIKRYIFIQSHVHISKLRNTDLLSATTTPTLGCGLNALTLSSFLTFNCNIVGSPMINRERVPCPFLPVQHKTFDSAR